MSVGKAVWGGGSGAPASKPRWRLQEGDLLGLAVQQPRQALVGLGQHVRLALDGLIPATPRSNWGGRRTGLVAGVHKLCGPGAREPWIAGSASLCTLS